MAKKKSIGKPIQLSPENYIRTKSRNLPIIECFINKNWKESKMCNILIVRQHANENVTFCAYLVDLLCLGVKETLYQFNVPYEKVTAYISNNKSYHFTFKKIPYKLAHNVIHAGIEYAEEYGFQPCKEFSSVTGYFLEEDTDAIPLIKIECGGTEGKPMYVNTGFESAILEKQIIAQLEKTAGAGNYDFILPGDSKSMFDENDFAYDDEDEDYGDEDEDEDEDEDDEDDDDEDDDEDDDDEDDDDDDDYDDDDDDDDDDDYDDDDYDDDDDDNEDEDDEENEKIREELKGLSQEEQKKMFFDLMDVTKKKEVDDTNRLIALTMILIENMVSQTEIDERYSRYNEIFDMDFVEIIDIPNSLFMGVKVKLEDKLIAAFFNTLEAILDDNKPKKAIADFRKRIGDCPISDYLEMYHYRKENEEDFSKRVKAYYQKYPDYLLFKMQYLYESVNEEDNPDPKLFESLLKDQKQAITVFEAELFFHYYSCCLFDDKNTGLPDLLAFMKFYDSLEFISDNMYKSTYMFYCVTLIRKLHDFIKSKELDNDE